MYTFQKASITVLCALVLVGCSGSKQEPMSPLTGPPIQDSATPYSDMLACLGDYTHNKTKYVMTVERIPDKTGKFSSYGDGYKVTQGAEDMVLSAIGKTNSFLMVERTSLNVPLFEVQYANDYLLSDRNAAENVVDAQGRRARAIHSGIMMGSDYVVAGSISEINYNIASGGFHLFIDGIGGGWRQFWMDVGMDLRVVDTQTTQIVMTLPIRKQLWGYENQAGVVRFFDNTFVDFDAGLKGQEPVQIAVRTIIESAVADITRELYNVPDDACEIVVRDYYIDTVDEYTTDKPLQSREPVESVHNHSRQHYSALESDASTGQSMQVAQERSHVDLRGQQTAQVAAELPKQQTQVEVTVEDKKLSENQIDTEDKT